MGPQPADPLPVRMRAVRLHPPGGLGRLVIDEVELRPPTVGEALVTVRAAAITRGELDWPADRLPAIPSYELCGVVAGVGPGVAGTEVGERVYALTGFDRDGVAAEYATVPAAWLAPAPSRLDDAECAALPLAGLTAWQGLFVHGGLRFGERVLIHGATGGVGHLATQLAHRRGAQVIATVTTGGVELARRLGADQVIDRTATRFEGETAPVDLVFDTVGGKVLQGSAPVVRDGGRLVSVAAEPSAAARGITTAYFIVQPDRDQLTELSRLADEGALRVTVDAVFPLSEARAAFQRVAAATKRGKVVLRVSDAASSPESA